MPATTKAIIKGAVDENISAVDILWCNIMFLYASIVRAQKIMYVKNHDDLTKELKKQSWGKRVQRSMNYNLLGISKRDLSKHKLQL